ncbi:MAG: helicase-related protein [Clostridiaceae bacterium]
MKNSAIERNFRKIKNQISQIETIVRNSKPHSLWEHDVTIRKKLKELNELKNIGSKEFKTVYGRYYNLLEEVSERLLDSYNKKNDTNFTFREIVKGDYEGFLKSGIIAVLISSHIPEIISKEFEDIFPSNPKNEYIDARKYKRKVYLHLGETNTGKTYNAIKRLKEASNGIYLSPLRILALENYERMNKDGVKCNLLTGEEEIIVEGANHISCTIEKLNIHNEYQVAVIDEIQLIDDDQRGAAWTRAVLALKCNEIHICGALNSKELLIKLLEDCDDEYEIQEYKRDIPLEIQYTPFHYNDAEPGDALVVFSKKKVLQLATYYANMGIKASLIYGDLPPEVRKKQYENFINKETTILIATDAIGLGVNLPIKRIIFMAIKKFDGTMIRELTSQEVKQIAGRAGRKGIYDTGYVATYKNTHEFLRDKINAKDRIIEQAVLGPSEEILKVKSLSLREKLALWSTKAEKIPYYRKMDIEEYLIVLDNIKRYKLPERIQYDLLKVPFDVSNEEMLKTFLEYVEEAFMLKYKTLTKPKYQFKALNELEIYYQKINLYYSFSKNFQLTFDDKWVYQERQTVSEYINELIINSIFS